MRSWSLPFVYISEHISSMPGDLLFLSFCVEFNTSLLFGISVLYIKHLLQTVFLYHAQ